MKIDLDKFELKYFLESCANGSHLRQGVWRRCIDEFYEEMDDNERNFIFHYSVRDLWDKMVKEGQPRCGEEAFRQFIDCFNPANRYKVTVEGFGDTEAFIHDGMYYVTSGFFCIPEAITEVEQDTERLKKYRRDYGHLLCELHGHIKEFEPVGDTDKFD